MVVLLHLGYGMTFSYRCSRPDTLGMYCLLLLILALSIPHRRGRGICVLLLGALAVWIGVTSQILIVIRPELRS